MICPLCAVSERGCRCGVGAGGGGGVTEGIIENINTCRIRFEDREGRHCFKDLGYAGG